MTQTKLNLMNLIIILILESNFNKNNSIQMINNMIKKSLIYKSLKLKEYHQKVQIFVDRVN